MEIRGLTREQIELACERASKQYGGNLYLPKVSYEVPKAEPWVETKTYTARASWRVMYMDAHASRALPEKWEDYGYFPYVATHNLMGERLMTEEQALDKQRLLCEERVQQLRDSERRFSLGFPTYYKVEWIPEHEKSYEIRHDYDIEEGIGRPLNKRGDAFSRVRLKVRTARRPGSRVSQQRWTFMGPLPEKPKRIASACWHAHRDFMREVFGINPDARIKSALADYRGSDDFERKFPNTYESQGMAGPCPIENIGSACNCDEGAYPEYAIEGLTPEQYEMREAFWGDESESYVKKPKYERAVTKEDDAA